MISSWSRICKFAFGRLDGHYLYDRNQQAVIFAHKGLSWTQKLLIDNAKALSNGLTNLNYIEGDTILVRMNAAELQEKLVIRIGAANHKAKVIVSKANTQQQFAKQLEQTKARSIFFSSYQKLGKSTVVDAIFRLMPQLLHSQNNKQILPRKFRYLRSLIQTDNYQYPGTFRFKNIMMYGLQTEYGLQFECNESPIKLSKLPNSKRPIVITQPCAQLAFRGGVLNCLQHGNLLICALPVQVKQISDKYNHQIDVICTQPMTELHEQNRVFVQAGSKLYEKHPQRHQIIL